MTLISAPSRRFRSVIAAAALLAATAFPALAGSQVARRLYSLPSSSDPRVSLPDTVSPRVKTASVLGHVGGETQLSTMSLIFKPTAEQQTALTQLLSDLQNPSSPQYHQWLTPQQFGQRFGMSDADLAIVKDWLTSQGFTVQSVSPARNRIVFSGNAATAETAFKTSMERYRRDGQDYLENSTDLSLPSTLAQVVGSITGLSSFHLAPPRHPVESVTPQFTSTTSKGTFHYLVPWDFRQIFGVNTLISQGYDGTGIKIGVLGQSTVSTTQLTYFQQNTGQTVKMPTMTLVPSTGSAGQLTTSDEGESELDLEYASGTAPGATILFIYTGLSSTNSGVFDSMAYAIEQNLAPILTLSYGGCESSDASYAMSYFEPILAQAAAQGQTILASTGDNGAAACESAAKNTSTTAAGGISVSYPASSPNVTAVGGTQLNSDDSQYWLSTNNSYGGSAIKYMPETSWNDTVAQGSLSATGGGASTLFGKPSWQTGTGVPADNKRDIPDVAFPAAVQEHPYIVCSVEYPCSSGSSFNGAGLYGGTSASAPNFAALLAVVQQANSSKAMGNINPMLYSLAAGSSASSIFHDITTGNNIVNCVGGTLGCSSTSASSTGTMGYSAGVGYDQVTGLGSLDANGLLTGLQTSSSSGSKSTPTVGLSASSMTPAGGSTVSFTVTVSGNGTAPTGTVSVSVDGTSLGSAALSSAGDYVNATYPVPSCTGTTSCTHTVVATYSGDTNFTTGTATLVLTVPTSSTAATGSIALTPAASTLTVTSGSTGNDVITITSTGFAGTVSFKASTTANLTIGCYNLPSVTVASGASVTSTLTVYTSTANCTSASATSLNTKLASSQPTHNPWQRGGMAVFAAGLVGAFFLRKRIRPAALLLVLLSAGVFSLSGCGGSSSSSSTSTSGTTTAAGSYPLTITATGVPSNGAASITATTTVTLVVQ